MQPRQTTTRRQRATGSWLALTLTLCVSACAPIVGDDAGLQPTAGEAGSSPTPGSTTPAPSGGAQGGASLVTDGRITARIDPFACLHLPQDANTGAFTIAQLNTCNSTTPQRLLYTAQKQFTNATRKACLRAVLAPSGAVADANAQGQVVMAACDGNDAGQVWVARSGQWATGDGNWCLDLLDGRTGAGAGLHVTACSTADTQLWDYVSPFDTKPVEPLASQKTLGGRCDPHIYISTAGLDANTAAAFAAAMPQPKDVVHGIVLQDCNVLFDDPNSVPADRSALRVAFSSDTGSFVYAASGKSITFPAGYYLQMLAAGTPNMALGLFHQMIASYYVLANPNEPQWIRQGLWWYPRIRIPGYPTSARVKTGSYTDGGNATGFFFAWMEQTYPGTMQAMVRSMVVGGYPIDAAWFEAQTGHTLSDMWSAYLNSF